MATSIKSNELAAVWSLAHVVDAQERFTVKDNRIAHQAIIALRQEVEQKEKGGTDPMPANALDHVGELYHIITNGTAEQLAKRIDEIIYA